MCGIVGYITKHETEYEKARRGFLRYALMLDTLRGPDSTGLITVNGKFAVKNFKSTQSGFKVANSQMFNDNVPNGWCSIGHNRAATRGSVSKENAHPFRFGSISLVHNGTLTRMGDSLPTFNKDFEVDSMQIAYALSECKSGEAKSVLENIDGDFCIVWTDSRDKTINMARNNGRPMSLGWNYDRSLLIFMSDPEHLAVLSKGLSHTSAGIGTIHRLDAFQHLKWKKGNLRPKAVSRFGPFTRLVPRVPAKTQNLGGGTQHMRTNTETNGMAGQTPSKDGRSKAERRAHKKWLKSQKSSTTQSGNAGQPSYLDDGRWDRINRIVQGRDRKMPKTNTYPMVESLYTFLQISPDNLMRFQPDDAFDLGNGLQQVVGTTWIEGWKNSPWEATINFVPDRLWEAYDQVDWLVRPIGLTRNRENSGLPGCLMELVHCNYKDYIAKVEADRIETNRQAAQDLAERATKAKKNDIVQDPDGKLVNRAQLEAKFEKGCIQCSEALYIQDAYSYTIVNEGRDVICERCKWELEWPIKR